jgi:hypothetical protein
MGAAKATTERKGRKGYAKNAKEKPKGIEYLPGLLCVFCETFAPFAFWLLS